MPRLVTILIAVAASLAVHALLAAIPALWGGRASAAGPAVEVQILRQASPAPRREVTPVAPRERPRPAPAPRGKPAPRATAARAPRSTAAAPPPFGASARSVAPGGGSAVTIPVGGGVDTDPASRGRATSRPASVTSTAPVAPAPRPVTVRTPPRLLREHKVRYPDEARRLGIEGTVKLDVLVGEDGRVKEARVLAGPGFGLNEAAQRAMLSFFFAPAVDSEGKPRAQRIVYRYTFQID
jgi:periplasmic protein TonB